MPSIECIAVLRGFVLYTDNSAMTEEQKANAWQQLDDDAKATVEMELGPEIANKVLRAALIYQ